METPRVRNCDRATIACQLDCRDSKNTRERDVRCPLKTGLSDQARDLGRSFLTLTFQAPEVPAEALPPYVFYGISWRH